jgi:hypothetical protein
MLDEVVPSALDGVAIPGTSNVVPILQKDEVKGFVGARKCIDHAQGLVRQSVLIHIRVYDHQVTGKVVGQQCDVKAVLIGGVSSGAPR